MKHVSILVPEGDVVLSSVVGPHKIFNKVNGFLQQAGHEPMFKINLVGLTKQHKLYDDAFRIHCDKHPRQIDKTDLVIIPAICGNIAEQIESNRPLMEWTLKQRTVHGADIASFCMGAFLLASTGLVDGKRCSTHWSGEALFRDLFPKVNLEPEAILVEENGIYSSGGAYSFLNMVLCLVEKYVGREMAILASKVFEIDIDRVSQSHFTIFTTQKAHQDDLILKAQNYIESHFSRKLMVEEIAGQFALSRRNFIRRFKKATHNTPLEYIQRVKIEAAKKNFESTQENVNDVMYGVGYSDVKAFRTIFKKVTGLTPTQYRLKYNRTLVA